MFNILCLKWGDKLYNETHVNKLYAGCKRNTTLPFKFHCFTEKPEGIHEDIIIHDLPENGTLTGWWNKLYLFSREIDITGNILYIDLDTLVTGSIDKLLQADSKDGIITLRDFFLARMAPNYKDAFGFAKNAVGSGILSWEAGNCTEIWDKFNKDPAGIMQRLHPHGDQKFIQQVFSDRFYWQDILPDQCVSFKVHCRNGLPKNARLVCYHGKPSIEESINTTTRVQGYTIPPTKWVKDYWYE